MGVSDHVIARLRREYPDLTVVARQNQPVSPVLWPRRMLYAAEVCLLAPVVVGLIVAAGWGWRPGLAVAVPLAGLLGLAMFPSMRRKVVTPAGPVLAVRVTIEGLRGGHSKARCRYLLIVDTTALDRAIPDVWVAAPPDREIAHVNIWRAPKSFCPWLGQNLPSLCWHTFATIGWPEARPRDRTLGAALEYAKQLLNTENHDSPAR